jgi:hypothetical protein
MPEKAADRKMPQSEKGVPKPAPSLPHTVPITTAQAIASRPDPPLEWDELSRFGSLSFLVPPGTLRGPGLTYGRSPNHVPDGTNTRFFSEEVPQGTIVRFTLVEEECHFQVRDQRS